MESTDTEEEMYAEASGDSNMESSEDTDGPNHTLSTYDLLPALRDEIAENATHQLGFEDLVAASSAARGSPSSSVANAAPTGDTADAAPLGGTAAAPDYNASSLPPPPSNEAQAPLKGQQPRDSAIAAAAEAWMQAVAQRQDESGSADGEAHALPVPGSGKAAPQGRQEESGEADGVAGGEAQALPMPAFGKPALEAVPKTVAQVDMPWASELATWTHSLPEVPSFEEAMPEAQELVNAPLSSVSGPKCACPAAGGRDAPNGAREPVAVHDHIGSFLSTDAWTHPPTQASEGARFPHQGGLLWPDATPPTPQPRAGRPVLGASASGASGRTGHEAVGYAEGVAELLRNERQWYERRADLQLLTEGAPCAPHAEIQHQHLGSDHRAAPWGALPKFYLYEGGAFDLPAAKCLLENVLGANSTSDADFDYIVDPEYAQRTIDVSMLRLLRHHYARVHSPELASLHIIAAPVFTAALATSDFGKARASHFRAGFPCGTLKEHYRQMDALADALVRLPAWQRCNGCDFLLPMPFWDLEEVFSPHLLQVLEKGPAILGTSDSAYKEIQARPGSSRSFLLRNAIVMPFRTTSLPTIGQGQTPLPAPSLDGRTTSIMFHGNPHRWDEGEFRRLFGKFSHLLSNTSIREMNAHGSNMMRYGSELHSTLAEYRQSLFCFVPMGDASTSRRLYDALSSGCLPIVMANFSLASRTLPFPATMDWSRMAIFAGSTKCVEENFDSYVFWLLKLIVAGRPGASHSPLGGALNRMRTKGHELFSKYLDYNGGSLVSALLRQINVTKDLRHPLVA